MEKNAAEVGLKKSQGMKAEADAPMALATYMQPDGIHPNAVGVATVIADLGPLVIDLLETLK